MSTNTVQKIGKYDVQQVLGQGGMGIVYKAVDSKIGRPVAIKMMTGGYAENPDLLKRFYREAQASGMLQHRNIVTIFDLGEEGGSPYMVMEFISGESLEDMIQARKRLSMVEKLEIMVQVLAGLEYAHKHGIVHRDIKPGNIMILADGTVKIVDFGIARVQDNSMTKTGQIVGTINYMSPEQFNGHAVDGRSDIFSTGVLFFELLTGALPFEGAETPSVILKILNEEPPPLNNYIQGFPPELESILHKALAKDREERYASCADFSFELEKVAEVLRKDMVVEYVDQARTAVGKNELMKAKDLLLQVLKVDTKHADAQELMKDVQARMAALQRLEQVKQLRGAAEDALHNRKFEEALSCIEQAMKLDKNNAELAQLQKLAAQGKQRKEQAQRLMHKAQDLRDDGDLDAALLKADEALALDPADTSVQSLRTGIIAEVEKLKREKELNELVEVARREISERHFTSALQMIRKAESLSTGTTQIGSLRSVLASAREQEKAHIDLQNRLTDIELTLYKQNLQAAITKADDALSRFPDEPALVELRQRARDLAEAAGIGEPGKVLAHLAELTGQSKFEPAIAMLERALGAAPDPQLKDALQKTRKESEEYSKSVQQVVAQAQKLLNQKKADEAVQLLESQPASALCVPAFAELIQKGRAEQDQLNRVEVGVLEARALMAKNEVGAAYQRAKSLMQEHPGSAIVQEFLKELETKRSTLAKDAVEKAIRDAKALVLARQTAAASRTLQAVAQFVQHAPKELREAYEEIKKEVAGGAQIAPEIDSNKTVVHGSADAAPKTNGGGTAVMPAPEKAATSAPAPAPVAPAKPFPMKPVAAVVFAIIVAVGGYFGYGKFFGPPPVDSYVEINAIPYAEISSIVTTDGKRTVQLTDQQKQTPTRIPLAAGDYKITFSANGQTAEETVHVSPSTPGSVTHIMESLSPNEIVQTSN